MDAIAIDPNQFNLDFNKLSEVLVTILVFGIFVNRVSAILLEARLLVAWVDRSFMRTSQNLAVIPRSFVEIVKFLGRFLSNAREVIVLGLSIYICLHWKFDAFTILLSNSETVHTEGAIVTGGIVAGVSKLLDVFIRDFLGVKESSIDKPWRRNRNQSL